eukprot:TRINITY_DN10353_c0_g1_i1.p1 TRINITY_DN10353_c0_g1~~TRINITY_DN10353_c0_g1_i1.p1  ORF type:complete len:382 (+),score=75.43 TRINITY_DN10353_c0_g1_i1:652-1797(+)
MRLDNKWQLHHTGRWVSDPAATRYLRTIGKQCPAGTGTVTVKHSSDQGRGLFAARDIKKGELVLSEMPLGSCGDDSRVCDECQKFLVGAEGIVSMAVRRRVALPDTPEHSVVQCRNGCGINYCSKACERRSWANHHQALCGHPLYRKLLDYCKGEKHPFKLAIKMSTNTLVRYHIYLTLHPCHDRMAALRHAFRPYVSAERVVWWEGVNENKATVRELKQDVRYVVRHLRAVLKRHIPDRDGVARALFDPVTFSMFMSAYERNNMTVYVASPVHQYAELHPSVPLPDLTKTTCFEPAIGTAYYTLQSCANHSCTPSIEAATPLEAMSARCCLTALRDVRQGEELTISYVDTEQNEAARAEALRDYGFKCTCKRCTREREYS